MTEVREALDQISQLIAHARALAGPVDLPRWQRIADAALSTKQDDAGVLGVLQEAHRAANKVRNDPRRKLDNSWREASGKIVNAIDVLIGHHLSASPLSTKQEAGEVERARRSYSIGFEEAKGDAANKVLAMARDFKNHGSIDRLEPFTEIALAIRAIPCPETATQEAGEVSRSQTAIDAREEALAIVAWDEAHPKKRLSMVTRKAITVARAYLALSLPAPDGSSAAAAAPLHQDTQKPAASTDQIVMDWMQARADWDTDVGEACRVILGKFLAAMEAQ